MSTSTRALFLGVFLLSGLCLHAQAQERKTVTVGSAEAFIRALASDTEIVLKPGRYQLDIPAALKLRGKSFRWEQAGDGRQLVISGLRNLLIRGQDTEAASVLSMGNGSAAVLVIEKCERVSLQDLNLAHKAEAAVEGTVLMLTESSDISLAGCLIVGPGALGLDAIGVKGLSVANTSFLDLSMGAFWANSVSVCEFRECYFSRNRANPLLMAYDAFSLEFNSCSFEANSGELLFDGDLESGELPLFLDCSFKDNRIERFAEEGEYPLLEECSLEGNDFTFEAGTAGASEINDEQLAWYGHEESGLSFPYPAAWEVEEEDEKLAFKDSYNGLVVFFIRATGLPQGTDAWSEPDKAFDVAAFALSGILKEEIGLDVTFSPQAPSLSRDYLPAREYRGTVKRNGLSLPIRLRTMSPAGDEGIWCLVTIAQDESSIGEGSEVDRLYLRVDYAPKVE